MRKALSLTPSDDDLISAPNESQTSSMVHEPAVGISAHTASYSETTYYCTITL